MFSLFDVKRRFLWLFLFGSLGVFQLMDAVKQPGNIGKALEGGAMLVFATICFVSPHFADTDFANVEQARRSITVMRFCCVVLVVAGFALQHLVK